MIPPQTECTAARINLVCGVYSAAAATFSLIGSPMRAGGTVCSLEEHIAFPVLFFLAMPLLLATTGFLLFHNRRRGCAGLLFLFYTGVALSFCAVVAD